MRKREKLLAFFLTVALMLTVLPFTASANSPEPRPWYEFHLMNLPEGTEYVDLLILLPMKDERHVDTIEENIPEGFSENAEILQYCTGSYRSYTFHYRNARSVIDVDELDGIVRFCHADEIMNGKAIRLAMLDHQGNILKLSSWVILGVYNHIDMFTWMTEYDGEEDSFLNMLTHYYYRTGVDFIQVLTGVIFTCIIELLVAVLFRLDDYCRGLIACTNVISKILMRMFSLFMYILVIWDYSFVAIVLEIIICWGEYQVYRRMVKEVPGRKWLVYTVTANAASFVLGLLVYRIVLF